MKDKLVFGYNETMLECSINMELKKELSLIPFKLLEESALETEVDIFPRNNKVK